MTFDLMNQMDMSVQSDFDYVMSTESPIETACYIMMINQADLAKLMGISGPRVTELKRQKRIKKSTQQLLKWALFKRKANLRYCTGHRQLPQDYERL
jgi:predicted XRE-type DNA-binding protein